MALSNTEKYIVQGMLKDNHALTEIAEVLNKPYKSIQYYVSTLKESQAKIEENKAKAEAEEKALQKKKNKKKNAPPGEVVKPLTAGDLIITRTQQKKTGGVAVMTEAASEKADEFAKRTELPDLSHKIHTIKKDN